MQFCGYTFIRMMFFADVITPDWAARAPSREGHVDGTGIAVDEQGYLITAPKKDGTVSQNFHV